MRPPKGKKKKKTMNVDIRNIGKGLVISVIQNRKKKYRKIKKPNIYMKNQKTQNKKESKPR